MGGKALIWSCYFLWSNSRDTVCVTAPGFGLLPDVIFQRFKFIFGFFRRQFSGHIINMQMTVLFPSSQPRQEISLYFPVSGRDRELERSQETGLVLELQTASR